jgi:hypothetical protein
VSDVVKRIFGPSADEVGRTLGAVTGCLLERFDKYVYYNEARKLTMERNYRELSKSLNDIPQDSLCSPPPELA